MSYPIRNSIGSFPSYLWLDEASIIDALIDAILRRELLISVYDEEECAVERSGDKAAIQKEVAATDVTQFVVFSPDGVHHGWFVMIHGNRCDVISDHTANNLCEQIFDEIRPVIEHWEAQAC